VTEMSQPDPYGCPQDSVTNRANLCPSGSSACPSDASQNQLIAKLGQQKEPDYWHETTHTIIFTDNDGQPVSWGCL
jgi:hypothetical protein